MRGERTGVLDCLNVARGSLEPSVCCLHFAVDCESGEPRLTFVPSHFLPGHLRVGWRLAWPRTGRPVWLAQDAGLWAKNMSGIL